MRVLRDDLRLRPTGRPAKSTTSILEKLRRESIRLTQVQDIAGCRVIVGEVSAQDRIIKKISQTFHDVVVVDRRVRPSHGYRAVHVIIKHDSRLIEVQVRTALQHLWAELSEKLSDVFDPSIKYGGGQAEMREFLAMSSELVADDERHGIEISQIVRGASRLRTMPTDLKRRIAGLRRKHDVQRRELAHELRAFTSELARRSRTTR